MDYSNLTLEQKNAVTAIYESNKLLVAPMGCGKTVIAATAITELLDNNELTRVLIVTTKQIAVSVWIEEFAKWKHTKHIKINSAVGSSAEREKIINDETNKVIVLTFGTIKWLIENNLYQKFNGLLIDETTKIKKTSTAAVKYLRRKKVIENFSWRCGLSATPTAERIYDLFSQLLLIDGGKTFGTNFSVFSFKYFNVLRKKNYTELITRADTVDNIITQSKNCLHVIRDNRKDTLPKIHYINHYIDMPKGLLSKYKQFKKEKCLDEIVALTAATHRQKLQQIACGFIYNDDNEIIPYSNFRELALLDIIKNLVDENILLVYQYTACRERLLKIVDDIVFLDPKKNINNIIKNWNNREIKTLLTHTASAAHGIRLQEGGRHIVWYSPQYSNDKYAQLNARLWRTGQKQDVFVHNIIVNDTIDTHIVNRVKQKRAEEEKFMSELLALV